MSAASIQDPTPLVLLSSVTVTATSNSASFTLPQADCYALYLVASAASGTTPVVSTVLQTAMDGSQPNTGGAVVAPTIWVNTGIAFANLTASTSSNGLTFRPTLSVGEAASVITVSAGTASSKNQPINRKFMRLAYTVTGTTPSVTFSLYAIANPKGFSTV